MGSRGQRYKRQLAQLDRASEKYNSLQERSDSISPIGGRFYDNNTGREIPREEVEKLSAELTDARETFEGLRDQVIAREEARESRAAERAKARARGKALRDQEVNASEVPSGVRNIDSQIKQAEKQIRQAEKRMERITANSNPGEGMPQSYYDAQRERNELRERLGRLRDEKARSRKPQQSPQRRRVNGYGEATSREITSGTYERAQRRQKRNVDNFMGRR